MALTFPTIVLRLSLALVFGAIMIPAQTKVF